VVRILIVGEIRLYRDGLTLVLGQRPGFEVVGSVARDVGLHDLVQQLEPDVVLLAMAARDGDVAEQVQQIGPRARVVVLGLAEREPDIMRYAEAGVAGYVSRDASLDALVGAIECAVRGELQCSPSVAGFMLRHIATLAAGRADSGPVGLTARETEILRLIDEGRSNKEIARHLGIEVATVKNHVHNLLEKLHVHRRAEAAAQVRSRRRWPAPTDSG
jgi:two-component system, NarL family, nitrate/nitrite response regulator NarL